MLASARPLLDRSSLRRLLLLAWHQAYLLQHAHEIVKKILFHDLTLFVPARNGTEIHMETLVRGLDHRAVCHRHRTRSEERRVGKECRSRWSSYHEKKKVSRTVVPTPARKKRKAPLGPFTAARST